MVFHSGSLVSSVSQGGILAIVLHQQRHNSERLSRQKLFENHLQTRAIHPQNPLPSPAIPVSHNKFDQHRSRFVPNPACPPPRANPTHIARLTPRSGLQLQKLQIPRCSLVAAPRFARRQAGSAEAATARRRGRWRGRCHR
uniref:Uncharacterized protein n=1 Tax=Aegilops tauschii subsp. strangulata TaxID=200361 RepID=A0A453ETH4_AEGTS